MSLPARSRPPGCITDLVFDAWFAGELDLEIEPAVIEHTKRCPRCRDRHASMAVERSAFLAQRPSFVASPQQLARRHKRWVFAALLLMAAAAVGLLMRVQDDAPVPSVNVSDG